MQGVRPVPDPPRCRGVALGDGQYTGCAFGGGDVPPFTPPCDCPTCLGSGYEPDPPGTSWQPCRGIFLANGTYGGCEYGRGTMRPLTGPCDCPVCHGSGYEGVTATWIPHSESGDPECCGFLAGVIRGGRAEIVCNECKAATESVPAADLGRTFAAMELTLDFGSEVCPYCNSDNRFTNSAKRMSFTCRYCGESVQICEDIEDFFRNG